MITYILKIPIKHCIEARKNYTAKVKKMIQRDTKVKSGFDFHNISTVNCILAAKVLFNECSIEITYQKN